MNKSILVIDTPEGCYYCPLGFGIPDAIECAVGDEIRVNRDGTAVPDWCPLREVPKKKPDIHFFRNGVLGINQLSERRFADSYNSCIDEILKECDGK